MRGKNKYNAVKTTYNGRIYASKFEAKVAMELDWRLKAKEILAWEPQYKLHMSAYNQHGLTVMSKTHRVDFRIHELDGSYTLLEAKGQALRDWKDIVKWIEALWLPEHKDHKYEVLYNKKR